MNPTTQTSQDHFVVNIEDEINPIILGAFSGNQFREKIRFSSITNMLFTIAKAIQWFIPNASMFPKKAPRVGELILKNSPITIIISPLDFQEKQLLFFLE